MAPRNAMKSLQRKSWALPGKTTRSQAAQQVIPQAWTLTACQAKSQVLGVGDMTTACPTEPSLLLPTCSPDSHAPTSRLLGFGPGKRLRRTRDIWVLLSALVTLAM